MTRARPRRSGLPPTAESLRARRHDLSFPGGARKRADWCRPQSLAAFVNQIADLLPVPIPKLWIEAAAANWRFPFPCLGPRLFLSQYQPQTLFGEGAKGGLFLARDLLRAFEELIRNFNRCLHQYGCPYWH